MKDHQKFQQICEKVFDARDENPNYLGNFIPDFINPMDTSNFPLARTVPMPEGHKYPSGLLQFGFRNIHCTGLGKLKASGNDYRIKGRKIRMKFILGTLNVRGSYSLNAQNDPEINIDTAGNLMEIPKYSHIPLPAGADPVKSTFSEEQQAAYLDQARKQRATLMKTSNGPELMSVYNEHNEQYNQAFLTNPEFREIWKADGVTAQMAADTSAALTNGAVINSKDKKYANHQTYNANAFKQQMNMAVATVMLDDTFDPYGENPPNPDTASFKAAMATLDFKKVVNDTGNHDSSTTEMTSDHVYESVKNHSGEMPTSTPDELNQIVMQGIQPAGNDEGMEISGWLIDEEDRRRIRRIIESGLRNRMDAANRQLDTLWQGGWDALIQDAEVQMELTVKNDGDRVRFVITDTQVELPPFDMHIDDSEWSGAAGEIARKRLSRAYFIRSLLHHQLVDKLKETLAASVIKAFNYAAG
jgi:hypothetical protein